jgi:DNA-binding transcriptional MerR regulator
MKIECLTLESVPGLILVPMALEETRRNLWAGELARAVGVSTDTLRHYQRRGLLKKPPRTNGGYRLYPVGAVHRVQLIRNALAVGFSLTELSVILRVRDRGGALCQDVARMASEKVEQLDRQIADLIELRISLKLMIEDWRGRLATSPRGARVGLLESLPTIKQIKQTNLSTRRGKSMKTIAVVVLAIALSSALARGQVAPQHDHAADVDRRGDMTMGFSHDKSTHHFQLLADGGTIEVAANDKDDDATRDQIRQHLTHITTMFTAGDFNVPMLIHDVVPPGVPVMKAKQKTISYIYESTTTGARIRITTTDPEALKAVHEFLSFQIADHRTGDSNAVKPPA